MRPPGRHRDQRLPRAAGAAGRGDVRLPVRRSAAGTARTARCRHCPGEARMSAAKKQAAAADTAPAAITLIEAITQARSEEHTSELQSLMRISYAVFCLKKKKKHKKKQTNTTTKHKNKQPQ